MNKKPVIITLGALAVVCAGVVGVGMFRQTAREKTASDPLARIDQLLKGVEIEKGTSMSMPLSGEESAALDEVLPDLPEEYIVEGDGDIDLLVWSSPEKAGEDTDSWLKDLSESFNASQVQLDGGEVVSITLRSISSGLANDYISSGKAVPDLYTPSASIWGSMLEARPGNLKVGLLEEKLLGNTAGLFVSKDTYNKLTETGTNGKLTLQQVVEAVEAGDVAMGYTNPYTSTTGLNFLSALMAQNVNFENFQSHIPYVATTSNQMVSSAAKGTFEVFVGEAQQYASNPLFQKNYEFIPFGTRHDNPLYGLNLEAGSPKEAAARLFADYITTDEAIQLGKDKYFFMEEDYESMPAISGTDYISLQDQWKKEKDSGKTVAAFFIADTSGSMDGSPLASLQDSLMKTMQEINDNAYIGLISYADTVRLEMPLSRFDINAKARFKGAVYSLDAAGNTFTYEALCTALRELNAFDQDHPDEDLALKIILLSDGEANGYLELEAIRDIITQMKIPVYTVGYNYHNGSLEEISDLTESASLNADEQDVVTKLRDLFRINL